MTGLLAPRVVVSPYRAMSIKSALRDWLSVSYSMISTLMISRYAAPPYPAAPDFHLKVKRLTMICASLTLLQIMFAVHPRESVSHDSQVALLPYESCSLATPSGGQNKTPRDNLLINPPLEMTVLEPPSRNFDRSEAEWRNLTPPMKEKPARALRHFDRSGAEWRNLPL